MCCPHGGHPRAESAQQIEVLQAKLQSSSHLLVGRSRASQDSLNGEADGEIQELATPGQAGLSLPEATAHHVPKFPGSAALPRLLPCHRLMLQEAGGIKRAGATVLHENMGCKTNDLGYPGGGVGTEGTWRISPTFPALPAHPLGGGCRVVKSSLGSLPV